MVDEQLEKLLQEEYQQEIARTEKSRNVAKEALAAGNQQFYFTKLERPILPNICWAAEKYQEARRWYRHNARILVESRHWQEVHADEIRADYRRRGYNFHIPSGISMREAAAFVRSGMLDKGRRFLQLAYENESGQDRALKYIGMHAAQVGLSELASCAKVIPPSLLEVMEKRGPEKRRAMGLIHSEPAEVAFLLGDYDKCALELQKVFEGESLLREVGGQLYDDRWEERVLEIARGLRSVLDMVEEKGSDEVFFKEAVNHLEKAMLMSLSATDYAQVYFERLYTLMALDVFEDREPNPNPFTEANIPSDQAVTNAYRAIG